MLTLLHSESATHIVLKQNISNNLVIINLYLSLTQAQEKYLGMIQAPWLHKFVSNNTTFIKWENLYFFMEYYTLNFPNTFSLQRLT
jgi:hypothetical protein